MLSPKAHLNLLSIKMKPFISKHDPSNIYSSIVREVADEGINYDFYGSNIILNTNSELMKNDDVNGFWSMVNHTGDRISTIRIVYRLDLDKKLLPDMSICTLAHELGHHYDLNKDPDVWNKLVRYNEGHDRLRAKPGEVQKRKDQILVYKIEARAWDIALDVVKRHGYTNYPFFTQIREDSLASYSGLYNL